MDRSTLIEKTAKHFGVSDSEQKLFFEVFLRKCSELLEQDERVRLGEIGIIEFRGSQSEVDEDSIIILTNEEEEFVFDIPEEEKESNSIDSYFSLSIGKPVIPLKGEDDSEFFIPRTENELKKMFGLKVERFIDDTRKRETEESVEELSDDVLHVDFSFKNWKSSSNLDEVEQKETDEESIQEEPEQQIVNKPEQEVQDEFSEEEEQQVEEISVETEEESVGLKEEANDEKQEEPEVIDAKLETESEDLLEEKDIVEEPEEEIIDAGEEEKEKNENEVVNDEQLQVQSIAVLDEEKKDEEVPAAAEENFVDDEAEAIEDAFKYAEDKKARLENYRKRSFNRFIFTIIILAVISGIIYFAYYLSSSNNSVNVQQASTPTEFSETVERSYRIPITYPYEKGMLGEVHVAIDNDILKSSRQKTGETLSVNNDTSGVEIRDPLPATRIKGYIYKYENMYAVQVSSWKSKSIAVSETQKFLNAGYNAFIEKTELADKGIYYRVRVGSFNSLTEAEEFLKK